MLNFITNYLSLEAASSIILLVATVLAMAMANSPYSGLYDIVQGHSVSLVVNDGLMSLFFLLIGIEIRREMTTGELSQKGQAMLPFVAAVSGVAVPALIYSYFNYGTEAERGWAIPSATDIAFSLGVLAIFGNRIPNALKVFLMAVAVIDDLIAVIIIAIFYTASIYYPALLLVAACIGILYVLNRMQSRLAFYLPVIALLWAAMLASGVHATIAGVIAGLMLPDKHSHKVLHALHPYVAFGVVPLFAFANAGIALEGIRSEQIFQNVPMGIFWGLFAGKQIGIFAASWLLVRAGICSLPSQVNWREFHAVCLLAGIGFTMSLFIGALAFEEREMMLYTRLGVVMGSLASAIVGIMLMALALRSKPVSV